MGRILKFGFYLRDCLCSSVCVDYSKQEVVVVNYTDDIIDQAFGRSKVTVESIDEFFRERCFPETRVNCRQLLDDLGLKVFDAESIVRKTHGLMMDDEYWVKFEEDDYNINWDLIKRLKKSIRRKIYAG